MSNYIAENDGWEEVIELAGRDNEPSRAKASAMASQKQVLALSNLERSVFNAQKHISQRLEFLNEILSKTNDNLAEASKSQDKLSKWTIGLTIALVVATIVQAVAALMTARSNG